MPNITFERFICNENEETYRGIETGDTIVIKYGRKERYKAVVEDDTVFYEDGKQDLLRTILEQAANGICTVTRVNEVPVKNGVYFNISITRNSNSSLPFLTLAKERWENGRMKWARCVIKLGDRHSRLETAH